MKIGIGPRSPGITVRWRTSRWTGMLSLDRRGARRTVAVGFVYRANGAWFGDTNDCTSLPLLRRWEAKRWVERTAGDDFRSLAEAGVEIHSSKVLRNLAKTAREGAKKLGVLGSYLESLPAQ